MKSHNVQLFNSEISFSCAFRKIAKSDCKVDRGLIFLSGSRAVLGPT